jgi:excisionase family DNA binding protein
LHTEIPNTEAVATKQARGVLTRATARPDAWRVNDALAQLSISRATLYKLIGSGEIRMIKIAGRSLIPDSEIRRLLGEAS